MRNPTCLLILAGLLGGCVVAPAPGRYAVAPRPGPDPWCQQQRQEARFAQRVANEEAREAAHFGGRRQGYEAAAAQAEADRQRAQAVRAC